MLHTKIPRWKPVLLLVAFLVVVAVPFLALVPADAAATYTATSTTTITASGISSDCPNVTFNLSGGKFAGTCNPQNCVSSRLTGSCGTEETWTITNIKASNGNFTGTISGPGESGTITILSNGQTQLGTVTNPGADPSGTCNTQDANGNCKDSNPDSLSCTQGGGFFTSVLNWILCGAINLAWGAANLLDNWIMDTLDVDVSSIFDNTGNAKNASHGYYVAWNSFRVIATAILIIGGLIMVTAQALGFEALDAYTVRKVLPRLLIAVIGISLSWPLMRLVVDFFDTAGLDIREIMYAPFHAMHGTVSWQVGILSTLGVGATIFVMGPASLTFLLTAMLAAFVGFLILVIRQIAIVCLVILAPIAIACYILPNTQKVWKLWYDNFLGLMLMFPIISALIAAGHIFSAVTLDGGNNGVGNGVVAQAIGLIAYFAPYFLLPMAARMATGVIGNIAGFVNDRHRGVFDRLKGARKNATERNMGAMKHGNRFNNSSRMGRALNNTTSGIALAPSAGLNPTKWSSRYGSARATHEANAAEEIRTKNGDFMAGAQDDRILRAVQYGTNREDLRRRLQAEGLDGTTLDNAVGVAERMQKSGSIGAVRQAAAVQRFATGTGYNDANGEFDYQAAMDSLREVSEGDRNLAGRLLGTAKGEAMRSGQIGFGGASYGTLSTGLDQSFAGHAVNGDAIALNAFESNDAVSLARGRTAHVNATAGAANRRLNQLAAGAAERYVGERGRLTAQLESFRDSASIYAAPDRQAAINEQAATSEHARQDVHGEVWSHNQNPDAHVYNAQTRQPFAPPTPTVDQYNRNRGSRSANPNDPNLPPP